MQGYDNNTIRVAILDLYDGQPNQGMRCIREILAEYGKMHGLSIHRDEFDVRRKNDVPGIDYDVYISSGGPGSPLESKGSAWEASYFQWLTSMEKFNSGNDNITKKQVLFICHSFQLACRHYGVAEVTKRKSTAFGVFPVHLLHEGEQEPVFEGLPDPFYAVDSRDFQVIQPHQSVIERMGGKVLAIEKERPHIPLERAVMAIRFNEYMLGTQFHPEADGMGMSMYLQRDDRKKIVIENHGFDKWQSMIDQLTDPDKIMWTYAHVIPNFLNMALLKAVSDER